MTVKFELFNVFELYYYVLVVDNVAVKPHLQVLAVSTIRKTTKRTLFSVPLTELQSQVSCWIFFCYTATYKGSNIRKSNFFHVMQFFKCFYASWLGAVLFQQIGIAKMGKRLSVYHFIAHFPTTSPLFTQRLVSPAWCAPFLFGSLCSSFAKALHGGFYLAFNANQCLAVLGLYTHGVVQAQKRKTNLYQQIIPSS